ncbi:Aste57867_10099 [Aphanomyces stellatus]|uniref:Aste57867_10099 protein n=1 Tax=Aphanomyces stellatus TaxID=120398 RepID=A0A485KPH7_9STRA|nr:hypothetical protein As57867_010060 [Aphanomyces stellatus]VFT86975.1 Aste57867_10099 [Aphanomyces stellatus]
MKCFEEDAIEFKISLDDATPQQPAAGSDSPEKGMPLIQAIHRAVLETVKRTSGRAFDMSEIAPIKALCDQLLPADLGLDVPKPRPAGATSPRFRPIQYIEVYEDANVSMGIFILPPGASIPLHNHPSMTVISRVLYGAMHVNAFDLIPADEDETFWSRKEKRKRNGQLKNNRFPRFRERHLQIAAQSVSHVVTGPSTTELLPDRHNIHEFTAQSDIGCAIFDILTPGYNPLAGRDCTYYRALMPVEGGTNEEPWYVLEPSSMPPSTFISVDLPYRGPVVPAKGSL